MIFRFSDFLNLRYFEFVHYSFVALMWISDHVFGSKFLLESESLTLSL